MAVMIIQLFQFILFIARSDQMQQNYKILFENKIARVSNLLHFNDGQRDVFKNAAWIALHDLMLSQPKEMNDDDDHIAQWLLTIQIGKNVQEMFNQNTRYASNDLWKDFQDFSQNQSNSNQLLQLIDYLVERCR